MVSATIQHVLEGYRAAAVGKRDETEVLIHVDEIASKIAKFYEQVRKVVDYREEHLLRKNSIVRALRRHVLLKKEEPKNEIAESLVKEIIRAGHLPNDTIPERKIKDVEEIISSLLFLLDRLQRAVLEAEERFNRREWLIRMVASAIEETLDPPYRDRLIAEAMFFAYKDRLVVKGRDLPDQTRLIQLFIAIERALLRVDEDQLSWRLSRFLWGNWLGAGAEALQETAKKLPAMQRELEAYGAHELAPHFFRFCNRYNTVFLLLGDAIFNARNYLQDPEELFRNEVSLETVIGEVYRKRYEQQKRKLRRFAFFTVISLFISKVLVALLIEIPIDVYVTRGFSFTHAAANIAFPPFLMLLILGFIRMPSKKNLERVQEEVRAVAFADTQKEYLLVIPQERKGLAQRIARGGYWVVSLAVLWGLLKLLWSLGFSMASIVVFVLFTSIVAATGLRVHNRSREISLEEGKPTFKAFLVDLFFMPLVSLGQWVISGMRKLAFLVVAMNMIEAPFQVFIGFIENFNAFIKRKKDELY